jgi:sec-independent protein translocase protein TatA
MFDPSAPHIIILLIVILLLFGARRLPGAAKSLGESMNIFKRSVQGLDVDEHGTSNAATPQPSNTMPTNSLPTAAPSASIGGPQDTQQQLQDLQRQVADLQRQAASGNGSQLSETQTPQPF